MDRRQHQMTRQRRLHSNLGGIAIPNFANHDLVGVVTQDRTKPLGKTQALLFIHGNLQNARQLIFNRVFDRDDFFAAIVQLVERTVQGRGLAGASGPGHQQHPIGLLCQLAHGE